MNHGRRPRRVFRSPIWRLPRGPLTARRRTRIMTGVPEPAGVKSFRATVPISHSARLRIDVPVVPPPATKDLAAKTSTSSSAKCSLTTSSAAPGDTVAGTPAWRQMAWTGPSSWFKSQAQYTNAAATGWGGASAGIQHMGQPANLGGQFMFKGTSALGDGGAEDGTNPWYYQQLLEGRFGQHPMTYANAAVPKMLMGIGFYTKSSNQNNAGGADTDLPPLGGDWYNTTQRANVASYMAGVSGMMKLVGMQEIHFDTELADPQLGWDATAYRGNTHTEAQNRQAAFDFGKEMALGFYGVSGSLSFDTAVYSWYMTQGAKSTAFGYDTVLAAQLQEDFWVGWMEGMRQRGATSYFYNADATLFRPPFFYMAGLSYANYYKVGCERPFAYLSQRLKPGLANSKPYASEVLWSYVAKVLRNAGFTWRHTSGAEPFYDNSVPDDAEFSDMIANARERGMGPKRWEYSYGSNSFPGGGDEWSGGYYISSAATISGMQAAAVQTPISTSVPTITNLARVNNGGGSFTITCRASHLYGVTHVELYLGAALLQTMQMTWQANGGSVTTNLTNSYQDCTATLTGRTVGETIIVKAYSAKDDIKVSTIVL